MTVIAASAGLTVGLGACSEAQPQRPLLEGSAQTAQAATGSLSTTIPAPDSSGPAAAKGGPAPTKPPGVDDWPPPIAPTDQGGDRIYSKVRHLWIRPAVGSRAWEGYLSLGDSVRVKDGNAEQAFVARGDSANCEKWYAVEPTGFACTGRRATLDATDPEIVELRRTKADPTSPWPYRYGESLGVPVYSEPPSEDKQGRSEPGLKAYLDKVAQARQAPSEAERQAVDKRFFGMDFDAASKGPPPLLALGPGGRSLSTRVVRGSTIAYAD
ncbi:MAG: hypothetical protein DRI90_28570, partial [Deltaproteobacteria bacterium]